MSVESIEVTAADTRRAELAAGIRHETEIRRKQGDHQKEAMELQKAIEEFAIQTRAKIVRCQNEVHQCGVLLSSIESMKRELLATTPEGKRITQLSRDIAELSHKDGAPVLVQLRRAVELASDRAAEEPAQAAEAARLRDQIERIESEISSHQQDIERLWAVLLSDQATAVA